MCVEKACIRLLYSAVLTLSASEAHGGFSLGSTWSHRYSSASGEGSSQEGLHAAGTFDLLLYTDKSSEVSSEWCAGCHNTCPGSCAAAAYYVVTVRAAPFELCVSVCAGKTLIRGTSRMRRT